MTSKEDKILETIKRGTEQLMKDLAIAAIDSKIQHIEEILNRTRGKDLDKIVPIFYDYVETCLWIAKM